MIIGDGDLALAPRTDRPTRRETKYLVTCPACGQGRWLNGHDARKGNLCRKCAAIRSTTVSSKFEDAVAAYFESNGYVVKRHIPIFDKGLNVDMYIPFGNIYVEVVGYWHKQKKDDSKLPSNTRIVENWWDAVLVIMEMEND
jgi:hypothetical protein